MKRNNHIIDVDSKRKELGIHIATLRSQVFVIEETLIMGITQDQLSDIVEKLSVKTVGDLERGKVNTGINSLYRIATAFNIELYELLNTNFSFEAYYYKNEIIIVKKNFAKKILCSKKQYTFYLKHLEKYKKTDDS